MRVVLSPEDMGDSSYRLLLPVLAISSQVVLFRPSLQKIDRLFSDNKLSYNARDFVRLVELGFVVVSARNSWFDGRNGRGSVDHWAVSPWTQLDDRIAHILKEDLAVHSADRRVLGLNTGQGQSWAEKLIDRKPELADVVNNLFLGRQLPPGHLDHAAACSSIRSRAVTIFGDARNLCNLEEETFADISLHPTDYIANVATLGCKRSNIQQRNIAKERDVLWHALDVVKGIERLRGFEEWLSFLQSPGRREFARRFAPFVLSPTSRSELRKLLIDTVPLKSWAETLMPTLSSGVFAASSLVLTALAGPLVGAIPAAGAALSLLSAAPNVYQKLGIDGMEIGDGAKWIFLLNGKRRITEGDVREMIGRLSGEE